jgi:predicted Zn-dependent protease
LTDRLRNVKSVVTESAFFRKGESVNRDEAKKICDKVLSYSSAQETEVIMQSGSSALTRFANNQIEQNVNETGVSLSVRTVFGKKVGRASTNMLDEKSLKKMVGAAQILARVQPDDEELLPMPQAQRYTELKNYVEATADFGPKERAEALKSLISRCRKEKNLTASGIFSNEDRLLALANSRGLFACDRMTEAVFSATVMTDDSAGWAEETNKDVREIDFEGVGNIAIEKAVSSKKPAAIKPGEYTVILEPSAAGDLLIFLGWLAFGALAYQEGRSFLSGKLGQKVFGENITIEDDVYHDMASGLPFDFEGMPRQRVALIEKGVAKNVVHSRRTAKKAKTETTGHGLPEPNTSGPIPLNLALAAGNSTLEEMIKSTEKGILVTQFHYTNTVNPMKLILTGMTRNGTFLIENGKVNGAVKNLRFTESLEKVLSNVEMLGKELVKTRGFFGGGLVTPAMKVRNFTFSSATEF